MRNSITTARQRVPVSTQQRRDVAVILASCFSVLLMGALGCALALWGVATAIDRLALIVVAAAVGSLVFLVGLILVAFVDARTRSRVALDARRLEQAIRTVDAQPGGSLDDLITKP